MGSFRRNDESATKTTTVGGGLYITKNGKYVGALTQAYDSEFSGWETWAIKAKMFTGQELTQSIFLRNPDGEDIDDGMALVGSLTGVLDLPEELRTRKMKFAINTWNDVSRTFSDVETQCDAYPDVLNKKIGMVIQIQKDTKKDKSTGKRVQRVSKDGVPYFKPVIIAFFNADTGQTYGEMKANEPAKQIDELLASLTYPDNHPMTTGMQPAKSPAKTTAGAPSPATGDDFDESDIPF